MERKKILERVQETFRDLLGNDDIVLSEDLELNDIGEWSSLAQTQILTELEHVFKFRFSLIDIMSIKTVGNIVNAIMANLEYHQ